MNRKISVKIPYGKRSMRFSLPAARLLGILTNKVPNCRSTSALVRESLGKNSVMTYLDKVLLDKRKLLLVVPDATRKAHLKEILPVLLKAIRRGKNIVDIIIATGSHKAHTESAIEDLMGKGITKSYRIINHDQDEKFLMDMGKTVSGVPVVLNKLLKEYDAVMSVGVIEPHLYAGYSGGIKTVTIGLAGMDTINATHSVNFLDNQFTKIGLVEKNPFQSALWDMAKGVNIVFSLNVINRPDGKALKIFCGPTKDVFENGVRFSKDIFEIERSMPADIVICGIGYPKDINLYQASRAINYILNVDNPVLKKQGVLIIAAELSEGAGEGPTEKRFFEEMRNMPSPGDYADRIRREGCVAGVHRAYMVAGPLQDHKIVFVTNKVHLMNKLPFSCFKTINSAIKYAENIKGRNSTFYVIPHALSTIAKLK